MQMMPILEYFGYLTGNSMLKTSRQIAVSLKGPVCPWKNTWYRSCCRATHFSLGMSCPPVPETLPKLISLRAHPAWQAAMAGHGTWSSSLGASLSSHCQFLKCKKILE